MKIILVLLGMIFAVAGALIYYRPERFKSFHNHLLHRYSHNINILILLCIGAFLIISAPASRMEWVVFILGIIAVSLGIFFIVSHDPRKEALIECWMKASSKICKLYGIGLVIFALVLIFFRH